MSNVADAKKRMEEIEKQLSNQQYYASLRSNQKRKLFQEYLMNMAQADEAYHANEAKYEKKLKGNLQDIDNDYLYKLAGVPYGADAVRFLKADCIREDVFYGTTGPEHYSNTYKANKKGWNEGLQVFSATKGDVYTETRTKFENYLKNDDLKGFVDLAEEIYVRNANETYDLIKKGVKDRSSVVNPEYEKTDQMEDAFRNCIRSLVKAEMKKEIKDGKEVEYPQYTEETKKQLDKIYKEISGRQIPDAMRLDEKAKEKAKELKTGNVPEIALMQDNDKFLGKVAKNVVLYQDPVGIKFNARFQALNVIDDALFHEKYNGKAILVDGQPITNRFRRMLMNDAKAEFAKTGFIKAEDAGNDLVLLEEKIDGMIQVPADDVDGFKVQHKEIKPGESMFYQIPEMHKKIMDMSENRIFLEELKMQEANNQAKELRENLTKDLKNKANDLLSEMDNLNPKPVETEGYRDLKDSVKNFTRYGTKDFIAQRIKQENGQYRIDKTDKQAKNMLAKSTIYLRNVIRDYRKEMDESGKVDPVGSALCDKLEDFSWDYSNKIDNLPEEVPVKDFELMKKAKQVRVKQEFEVTDKIHVNVQEDRFKDEIQVKMKAYKEAEKLHRCSSYFKNIEKDMKVLQEKLTKMMNLEKAISSPKNEYEPGSYQNLLKAVNDVKDSIAKVRKTNADYVEHKKKDKEWGPNAHDYSQKRLLAVEGIEGSLDWFSKTMDEKLKYATIDAERHAALDSQRLNVSKKLQEASDPMLDRVAKEALKALDKFCKMPRQQSQLPMKDKEIDNYRYELAAITLADYAKTASGKKFLDGCRKDFEKGEDGYRRIVGKVANSDAFKTSIPKDISRDELFELISSKDQIHDLRARYVMNQKRAERGEPLITVATENATRSKLLGNAPAPKENNNINADGPNKPENPVIKPSGMKI